MRTYFRSLADVMESSLATAAKLLRPAAGQHRVLKSTRLEDMVYQELRRSDSKWDALEDVCCKKLSTFPALSRDIYQSFYSLNVRKNDADTLSETAKRFNSPILDEVMRGENYPAIKAACEGRQLPAYEAAGAFISQVAEQLDTLMEREKKSLDTLERLGQKRDESMDRLRELLERLERSGPDAELEKQALKAANRAQSQVSQAEAVSRMVRDSVLQNQGYVSAVIAQAGKAAAEKAEDTAAVIAAWGMGADSSGPEQVKADLELMERVRQSETLMEAARYLGRFRELIASRRKNGYAYGCGETYSIELGGDINRALGSEFAMLATPETLPLFLRKLQRKSLKQYQRREAICKGGGDIICMLDESGSARDAAPWCKAVALVLLDIAAQGKRRFAMVHFSGREDFKTDLFLPGQYSQADVLRAADTFLDGNTDYETPLSEAIRLMEREGFENADLVFVTDGACALTEAYLEELKKKQAKLGFQITGVLLDQNAAGFSFSLESFCTEILRTSELSQERIAERLLNQRV
ncbi:MAG: hypothetical protein HFF18_13220 [Oscillospiraceae bacterium]|nr:hypothetical protein [Oscillospiraceae bacterium]